MQNAIMTNTAVCPWCKKGKTMSDATGELWISCQCGVCQRYYVVDCQTMQAYKSKPRQRQA